MSLSSLASCDSDPEMEVGVWEVVSWGYQENRIGRREILILELWSRKALHRDSELTQGAGPLCPCLHREGKSPLVGQIPLAEGAVQGELSCEPSVAYALGSWGNEAAAGWGTPQPPLHLLLGPRELVQLSIIFRNPGIGVRVPWGWIPDLLVTQLGSLGQVNSYQSQSQFSLSKYSLGTWESLPWDCCEG